MSVSLGSMSFRPANTAIQPGLPAKSPMILFGCGEDAVSFAGKPKPGAIDETEREELPSGNGEKPKQTARVTFGRGDDKPRPTPQNGANDSDRPGPRPNKLSFGKKPTGGSNNNGGGSGGSNGSNGASEERGER